MSKRIELTKQALEHIHRVGHISCHSGDLMTCGSHICAECTFHKDNLYLPEPIPMTDKQFEYWNRRAKDSNSDLVIDPKQIARLKLLE